jgi:hypothetical protein
MQVCPAAVHLEGTIGRLSPYESMITLCLILCSFVFLILILSVALVFLTVSEQKTERIIVCNALAIGRGEEDHDSKKGCET